MPGSIVDESTGDGVIVNQPDIADGPQLLFLGSIAISTGNGLRIELCPSCVIKITGSEIITNAGNGVELDDTSDIVYIDGVIINNGGRADTGSTAHRSWASISRREYRETPAKKISARIAISSRSMP